MSIGFPEELEKFYSLDEISLVNNYFQVLSKSMGDMRIGASTSTFASMLANASPLAGSKNHVLSIP